MFGGGVCAVTRVFKAGPGDYKVTPLEYPDYDLDRDFPKVRRKRVSAITGKATTLTPELEFQISLVKYYDARCRLDRPLRQNTRLYAVNPIPGKTSRSAELSKRAGLRAGVFDLCLMKKRVNTRGRFDAIDLQTIWLECKAGKGTYTEAQKGWLEWLIDTPVQCHEVRDLNTFIAILEA